MSQSPPNLSLNDPFDRLKARTRMLVADHGIFRYIYNLPKPIDEIMWRSAQPTPGQLRAIRDRGIRTVINLRGPNTTSSYLLEREACEKLGLKLIDFRIRSRDVPSKDELYAARDLFNTIATPALMHCKSGADRVGLMSALYLLIHRNRPVEEALGQLSLRFGHFRQAKTGVLDFFLEEYRDYNAKTPISFFDWVDTVYDPDDVKARFMAGFWPSLLVDTILRRE